MTNFIKKIADRYHVALSNELIDALLSITERNTYRKEEIVLAQGQVSHYMYIIEKGMIRQFYYKEGRDITEHFSCEEDIATCIESLFLKEPTKILIQAIEPSTIYCMDYAKWEALGDKHPEINRLCRRILEHELIVSQRKADSWRFESARERYERFCKEYPEVIKRASIAHIASYLLMTPETLSRVRAGVL